MAITRPSIQQSINSTNVADLLERILDKGIVIAGDIKIKLVDVELLAIQIRLVVCSVDKAKEMGIDWWNDKSADTNKTKITSTPPENHLTQSIDTLSERITRLETLFTNNS